MPRKRDLESTRSLNSVTTGDNSAEDPRLATALREAGARFAFLHGSQARGEAHEGSDTDVAAWWGTDPPAPWDVPVPADVDLLVLDSAPLEIAGRVALHGLLLFDDDPSARVRWQAQTRLIYLDEADRQRRLDEITSRPAAVVDERRVRLLLQRLSSDVEYLKSRAQMEHSAIRDDIDRLAALKYVFVTAIEGCLNSLRCAWITPTH